MALSEVNPNAGGVEGVDHEAYVIARGGQVCEGYCYPFAFGQSAEITNDSLTISINPGDEASPYRCIVGGVGAVAGDLAAGRFCIAMENIADQKQGKVKVKGRVRAKIANSTGISTAITLGTELHVHIRSSGALNVPVASYLDARTANTGSTPVKYVGFALEAGASTGSNGTTMLVDFDGWDGVGGGGQNT